MLLNPNLNDTAQKILWVEVLHMCEHMRNRMGTTGCMKSAFDIFYGEKRNIIGFFSQFGRIVYVNKSEKIKKQTKENTYN